MFVWGLSRRVVAATVAGRSSQPVPARPARPGPLCLPQRSALLPAPTDARAPPLDARCLETVAMVTGATAGGRSGGAATRWPPAGAGTRLRRFPVNGAASGGGAALPTSHVSTDTAASLGDIRSLGCSDPILGAFLSVFISLSF